MKRRHLTRPTDDDAPLPDASPLIDICFLLLIYFLVAATIVPRESDLSLSLPVPTRQPDSPEIEAILIRIADNGAIEVGSEGSSLPLDREDGSRDLPLLRSHLDLYAAAARAGGSIPVVRVEPSTEASHQRLIDVLNTLAAVGIQSATFPDF
jgi:biopolymer transport protein ExbD